MSNRAGSSTSTRLLNPASEELRAVVLDYLVHSCYTRAARAFLKETAVLSVDADGDEAMERETSGVLAVHEEDFALGELRKDIRLHILTGRIDEVTALLNKHFPSVLSEIDEDPSHSTTSTGKMQYLPSASVDPTHLALNLRIQAFIEAARTKPLLYYPLGSSNPLPHPPLLSGPFTSTGPNPVDEDSDMSDDTEAANAQLLHRAQNLYSEANQLTRPTDRATYLHELGHVVGILAYKVPEQSPLAVYMTQERRESVANQIDGAVLYRAKRATVSRIELYTRYTSTLWGVLHDKECKVPPRTAWPSGVFLPPTPGSSQETKVVLTKDTGSLENAILTVKKPSVDKETEEVLPPFDLHLFLGSKERC